MPPTIDWNAARALISQRGGTINLNAGTLSPTPLPVLETVMRLRGRQAESPSDFHWRESPILLKRSRERLATYLHCSTGDLLLLPNVTFAINFVISSLAGTLPAGAEIVTTDHEYGAMLYCLRHFADRDNLRVRQVDLPYRSEAPGDIVDAIVSGMTRETRIVFFSHCVTTTGLVLPATDIVRSVRERAAKLGCDDVLVIIDGAHAPGMLPVDISSIGADFYGANCHKWMMAPAGAGFLHVAPHRKSMLKPSLISWGYAHDRAKSEDDSGVTGSNWQWMFEFHGTLDRTPQMTIGDALDFRDRVLGGDESVRRRSRAIAAYARQQIASCGFAPATPVNEMLSGAIVAFDYATDDVIQFRDRMWNDFHIECPATMAVGKTFLRVSCGWFTTESEIDALVRALRSMKR